MTSAHDDDRTRDDDDRAWADALFATTPVTDDVQAMVGVALARDAARARLRHAGAGAAALLVAVLAGLMIVPRPGELLSGATRLARVGLQLAQVVAGVVPGGMGSVALVAGCLALAVSGLVLRAVPPRAVPLSSPGPNPGAAALALALATALSGWTAPVVHAEDPDPAAEGAPETAAPPGATGTTAAPPPPATPDDERSALELRGSWPGDRPERITIELDDEEFVTALRRVLAEGGVALLFTSRLSEDQPLPRVTASFAGTPLRDALDALAQTVAPARLVAERRNDLATIQLVPAHWPDPPPTGSEETARNWIAPGETPADLDDLPDRATFGADLTIGEGDRVRDVFSLGGDVRVLGEARDVATLGGDVLVGPKGRVYGDIVSAGGTVAVAEGGRIASAEQLVRDGAHVDGDHRGDAGWGFDRDDHDWGDERPDWMENWAGWGVLGVVGQVAGAAAQGALLFLLGLLFVALAPDRFGRLQAAIVDSPLKTGAVGLGTIVAAVLAIVVLLVTIIGIPVALLLMLALPLAGYVGAAVAASVLGAALPITGLRGRPLAQLAVGIVLLAAISLIPFAGGLVLLGAVAAGVGAFVVTRFGGTPPG